MRKFKQLWTILVATAIAIAVILVALVNVTSAQGIVSITPAYQNLLQIQLVSGSSFDSNNPSFIAQMALGPDGRLYAATSSQGTFSFAYDPTTHMLSDQKTAADINALGIGFQGNTMYLSQLVSPTSNLVRLTDDNGNGMWGESGETNVNIVEGIPIGVHAADNIQIQGNTLYLGIGTRTIDGGYSSQYSPTGYLGESSYSGSISWIQDLTQVPSTPNSAQLSDQNGNLLSNTDFITDGTPYTSSAPDKLVVHSSGARNPFGLAFDANGNLWMTNNYNRANSAVDGQSIANPNDALDNDLSDDVYDQFFPIKNQADYGFANGNWRDNSIAAAAGFFNPCNRMQSTTFDNLDPNAPGFHTLYDPNNPSGLGPSASADGFDFYKGSTLGPQFFNKAFVSRYNNQVQTPDGQETINYADVMLVDPVTGKVSVVANGFNNPLDVLADATGLFVADYSGGIYYISAAVPVS